MHTVSTATILCSLERKIICTCIHIITYVHTYNTYMIRAS